MAALPNDSFAHRYLPLPLIQVFGSSEAIEQLPLYPTVPSHVSKLPSEVGKKWMIYRGLDGQNHPFLYIEIPRLYPLIFHLHEKGQEPKNLKHWEISSFSPADSSTLRVAESHLKNLSEFYAKSFS